MKAQKILLFIGLLILPGKVGSSTKGDKTAHYYMIQANINVDLIVHHINKKANEKHYR